MNIALFTDSYIPIKNGVVTSVSQLKEGLEKRGHNVIILTVDVPNYEDNDLTIYRLPSLKVGLGTGTEFHLGLVNQGAVNRFLKKSNIEIIHTHSEFSIGNGGKSAAKKLNIPHVHTTHTMWEEYTHYILNGHLLSKGMIRKILKSFLKNVHTIVAPSIKAKKYFKQLRPDLNCVVINNGINVQKFKSSVIQENEILQLRNEFGLQQTDKLLIFVGRIGQEKRVLELFEQTSKIISTHDDVKMIFVGEGPELPVLRAKAAKMGLEKSFIFTGFVNWELVYRLYSISDIFVTASTSEVHPMTMIEASMCGLPLIARKDDSYMDLVIEEENGFLVDTDEQLGEKIELLLTDDTMRKSFSETSLEYSSKFTAEIHVEKMEKLYKKIIAAYPDPIDGDDEI